MTPSERRPADPAAAFEEASGSIEDRLAAALAKLALAARHELRQQAAAESLSAIQAQILATLARDGALRMGTLARRVSLTPATVSDSVAALEARGLVDRSSSSEDRRVIEARVTARGRRMGETLGVWPELFGEGIAALTPAEKTVLWRTVTRLILSLLDRGVIQEARMCVTCAHFRPDVRPGARKPHHCALVEIDLAPIALRLDCAEHVAAGGEPRSIARELDGWLAHP